MAVSISPAQMTLQVGSVEILAPTGRSAKAAVPTGAQVVESTAESSAAVPAVSSPSQLSTDMRVDDQRQIYYEVVNDRTGDVVYEIPPELVRKLGENPTVLLDGRVGGHSLDVKS